MLMDEDADPQDRRVGVLGWSGGEIVTQPAMRFDSETDATSRRPCLTVVQGSVPGQLFKVRPGKTVVGRGNECGIQFADPSLSRHHIQVRRVGATVHVYDLNSTNGSWVNAEPLSQRVLRDGDKLQLGPQLVLRFNLKDGIDEAFQRSQFEAMTRDSLTGCYNRLFFDSELAREVLMAKTTGMPIAVAMLDLDHFKAVNDTFGHGAGDQVLQDVARILRKALRSYDVVARYGGEEFAIIMRGAKKSIAERCMKRVRHDIANHVCMVGAEKITLTVSIGVASSEEAPATDENALMTAADIRMYVAKREGRDRVIGSELKLDTATDAEDALTKGDAPSRLSLVVPLPRGRVKLKPLSELTDEGRPNRKTLPDNRGR